MLQLVQSANALMNRNGMNFDLRHISTHFALSANNQRSRKLCSAALNASVLAALLSVPSTAQEISWSVPEDGGTPRDTNRIERIGSGEFRIRASFQEGGQSVPRHAVSHVDLICHNEGTKPASMTVHLDLSDDGKRTDYDNKPEAGMKQRDFIFIQSPGEGVAAD